MAVSIRRVRNFVVTKMLPEWSTFSDANFLQVKNSLAALQKIAAWHRSCFDLPVIGITGSNEKLSLRSGFTSCWKKISTSHALPIATTHRLAYRYQYGNWMKKYTGHFEAGISQPDEMEQLEPIIRPTIGVLTR